MNKQKPNDVRHAEMCARHFRAMVRELEKRGYQPDNVQTGLLGVALETIIEDDGAQAAAEWLFAMASQIQSSGKPVEFNA